MRDDTILFRTIWRCCTVILCTIAATVGGCTMHGNYLIAEASQHGVDVVKAGYAIAPSNMKDGVCALAVSGKVVTK